MTVLPVRLENVNNTNVQQQTLSFSVHCWDASHPEGEKKRTVIYIHHSKNRKIFYITTLLTVILQKQGLYRVGPGWMQSADFLCSDLHQYA